ncbi:MAG: hypothetical protein NC452_05925 [Eubacterium sp.]|nr:hypothetical protein [Eubacterium sp.]
MKFKMKSLFFIVAILSVIVLLPSSCSGTKAANNIVSTTSNTNITTTLTKIGDWLYYDETTLIVYFWNGTLDSYGVTMPVPYYASNGFPYRYSLKTNTLEEIQQ